MTRIYTKAAIAGLLLSFVFLEKTIPNSYTYTNEFERAFKWFFYGHNGYVSLLIPIVFMMIVGIAVDFRKEREELDEPRRNDKHPTNQNHPTKWSVDPDAAINPC